MKKRLHICASGLALVMALGASNLSAQEAAETPAEAVSARADEPVEVVVTATRRISTVREVPFSIAAFGGAELRTQQIFSPSALTQQVPGITLNTSDKSLSIV